jgi:hypothetical protein
VVSRASLVRGSYFESGSLPEKIIKIIFAPLAYTYLFEVHKEDDGKYYTQSFTKVKQPKQLLSRKKFMSMVVAFCF